LPNIDLFGLRRALRTEWDGLQIPRGPSGWPGKSGPRTTQVDRV